MRLWVVRAAIGMACWVSLAFGAAAQEPEQFPPPKQAVPPPSVPLPAVPPPAVSYYYVPYPAVQPMVPRWDTRNAWGYYGPNYKGMMVPRVVLSPWGSYYQANGQPYPWTGTGSQQLFLLPKTSD